MPVSLYAVIVTILFLALGMIHPSSCLAEGGVMIRRAATPSSPSSVRALSRDRGIRRANQRIGMSPIPYNPDQRNAPQTGQRSPGAVGLGGLADIRGLVKSVNRSVVSIRMLDSGSSWSLGDYGVGRKRSRGKAMGYGAGFIVSRTGHIVTNEHVLRNGSKIEVELIDGRRFFARVLRKDPKNDLALLKINTPTELPPVRLGDSDSVELGEWVVGIGNPYGIGQSLMIGIVSAKNRKIPGSGYPPLIQIDAAMNLGNSGGPLFNLKGEVVGINTILLWKSQGIGFATPINVARRFLVGNRRSLARRLPVQASGPLGPVADAPRELPRSFNPLAPPWRRAR